MPLAPALALLLAAATADPCPVVVAFDARSGEAVRREGSRSDPVRRGETLSADRPVCVEVTGVSTALYEVELTETLEDALRMDVAAGLARLAQAGPLASLGGLRLVAERLLGLKLGESRGDGPDAALRAEVRRTIASVDEIVRGERGVEQTQASALLALARMGAEPEETERIVAELRGRVGATRGEGGSPRLLDGVVASFAALDRALAGALREIDDPAFARSELVATAREVQRTLPEVLAGAREAERLATLALSSRSVARPPPISPSWRHAHQVQVTVRPSRDPALAGLAHRSPASFAFRIAQRLPLRLGGGLVAVVVPSAQFDRYGASGGVASVTGERDQRLLGALAIGPVIPALESRDLKLSVVLPEIVFAPITSTGPAEGVGVGLGWNLLHVGVGAAWVQRERLVSPDLGAAVPSGSAVRTRKGLSGPRLYLAVGLTLF